MATDEFYCGHCGIFKPLRLKAESSSPKAKPICQTCATKIQKHKSYTEGRRLARGRKAQKQYANGYNEKFMVEYIAKE